MAISSAGTFSTAATAAGGAQSITTLTIPTHDLAIISFHWYSAVASSISSVTLDSQSATEIVNADSGGAGNCSTQSFWATGATAGSSKTIAWTTSATLNEGLGISIVYLSGAATTTPIRDFDLDQDAGGASGVTGLDFVSGDWTLIAYSGDPTVDPTNSGANTNLVAKFDPAASGTVMDAGVAYKTDNGTIAIGGGAYTAIAAFTVKQSAGAASAPKRSLLLGIG